MGNNPEPEEKCSDLCTDTIEKESHSEGKISILGIDESALDENFQKQALEACDDWKSTITLLWAPYPRCKLLATSSSNEQQKLALARIFISRICYFSNGRHLSHGT